MSTDTLLNALSDHGTRVSLNPAGSLRLTGTPPDPSLLAEVKARKPELVAALQDARSLAADLYHGDGVEAFAADLNARKAVGRLSVLDWCTGLLALKLVRRWKGADLERAA